MIYLIIIIAIYIVLFSFAVQHDASIKEKQPIWHYRVDNDNVGPVSLINIRKMTLQGIIPRNALIWKEGWKDWKTADRVFPYSYQHITPSIPTKQSDSIRSSPSGDSSQACIDYSWSSGTMAWLILATILIPLIGIILGIVNMSSATGKKQQSKILIIIGCAVLSVHFILMFVSQILLRVAASYY